MQHEKKSSSLLSTGNLVIIFVAIVAVVFYVFAKNLSQFTAGVDTRRDIEAYDTVEERIRPFGRIKMAGDALDPGELRVDEVPQAEPHATVLTGPQVFNEACIVCHGNGIGGAPMLNDRAVWSARIAQGMETLYRHAIEGYTGSLGYMPPKGARLDLSDMEVNSAVDYMLSQLPD